VFFAGDEYRGCVGVLAFFVFGRVRMRSGALYSAV